MIEAGGLHGAVTFMYSTPTPLVAIPSRPKGWRVFNYDGTKPCIPHCAMMAIANRLWAKRKAA
jgi:hypothetical protein